MHRFPPAVRLERWRELGSGGKWCREIEERSNFMRDPLLLGQLKTLSCGQAASLVRAFESVVRSLLALFGVGDELFSRSFGFFQRYFRADLFR